MAKLLAAHPPWRQLLIISVALPLIIALAALAFAWPAARIAPRDLPVGIVGTSSGGQAAMAAMTHAEPGGFAFQLYANEASAVSAIKNRDIYGAFAFSPGRVTVLEASAASPTVAQILDGTGQQLAHHATEQAMVGGQSWLPTDVARVDVVATSASDPRELVLGSALLPLTLSSVIMAAAIALMLGFRPAWRQAVALTVVSATSGLGAYLIAQGFLGALPHEHAATWAVLSLTVFAMGATTAGLIALVGAAGLGLSAALMIYVGNAFSAATSAPQLLPTAVGHIGQWFPPGAAANLLRSTAYFNGNGAAGHLSVLIIWSLLGLAAIVVGHHAPIRFAAHASGAHSRTGRDTSKRIATCRRSRSSTETPAAIRS